MRTLTFFECSALLKDGDPVSVEGRVGRVVYNNLNEMHPSLVIKLDRRPIQTLGLFLNPSADGETDQDWGRESGVTRL
jgi:hypothetical protein